MLPKPMPHCMISLTKHLKIFDTVVLLVTVYMMYVFR